MRSGLSDPVADLDWVIRTPPLIDAIPPLLDGPKGRLPAPLRIPCNLPPPPSELSLGRYYEWLWQQLLRTQPVEVISNLVVQGQARTLGEFDLLYRGGSDAHPVHRELAVKFYLCAPNTDGSMPGHWVGPNPKDRLDLKLAHMLGAQVRLGQHKEAQEQLARLCWTEPTPEALIQGRLYRHWRGQPALAAPLNPVALQGLWLHRSELSAFTRTYPQLDWERLPRLCWLAGSGWPVDPATLEQQFEEVEHFRLHGSASPCSHLMLVTDRWLHHISAVSANRHYSWAELAALGMTE